MHCPVEFIKYPISQMHFLDFGSEEKLLNSELAGECKM